jgi:topoisomerase IA-like protein
MERLHRGEYRAEELVEFPHSYLGEYQDQSLYLKRGPYGPYLEWGDKQRQSVPADCILGELTLASAIELIGAANQAASRSKEASMIRILTSETSIRNGKYGPYIYHKTPKMKKPTFTSLKSFPGDYLHCSVQEVVDFLKRGNPG